jgi:hypothetical protein
MTIEDNDTGIICVVLQHIGRQCLPRVIEIKEKLDQGETLNEFEIEYLSEALHDTRCLLPYLERHSEYMPLAIKVIHYYKLITDEALANEKYNHSTH